jgi:pantetheine-phosphate adenylyltransferase
MFDVNQRLALAKESFAPLGHKVQVMKYEGSTVDFLMQQKARIMIRGIRSGDDFQYEADLAWANRQLSLLRYGVEVDTVFILAGIEKTHISSTLIKSYARVGFNEKELMAFVPQHVAKALVEHCKS